MLFNSVHFFALLGPTFVAYWLLPSQRARLAVLLVASGIFYAWSHPPSLVLLGGTIVLNYGFGRWLARSRSRAVLAAAVTMNLGVLAWFKYAAFLAHASNDLAAALGSSARLEPPPVWLPLGISFFTFQVIAYLVDVWRGEVEAERSPLVFAVFKGFFAQLIAGPIVRAHDFLPALRQRQAFDGDRLHRGVFMLLCGLGLKVGVADVLGQFASAAFLAPAKLDTSTAWLGLYSYALQLFADFWGYSTMAVGLGLMFGFELPRNFETPYRATSLQDFWRRWHITLSRWFRDYLYIPLGGNRRFAQRNLILTMTLAGLWHGAGWSFLLWGLVHGMWQAIEHGLRARRSAEQPERALGPVERWLRIVLVFHGVCLCWVLFRAASLADALAYFRRLLLPPYTFNPIVPEVQAVWLIGFFLLHPKLAALFHPDAFARLRVRHAVAITALLLWLALGYGGMSYDFIYFRF